MSRASRLGPAFSAAPGTTGLVPFITAGYPTLDASRAILRGLAKLPIRAVEIGIPFSDPIADGPDIQRASERALAHHVGARDVLALVADLRTESELPVVVMTYANPMLPGGIESFADDAKAAGVDGVIVSDLPPDESPEVWAALDRAGLDTVLLVAPTTGDQRLPLLLARSRGFVYLLARTGVTGRGGGESGVLAERVAAVRRITRLPIAVGFGISSPEDARALRGVADAVVVGAAFMRAVTEDPDRGSVERVLALAGDLLEALG